MRLLLVSLLLSSLVSLASAGSLRAELVVREYAPDRHDRFNDTNKQNFIGNPYDWSGVGRTTSAWGTMISPHYFLSATHLHPVVNSVISFYPGNDASSLPFDATVVSGTQIGSTDIWLGRLDQVVPFETYAVAASPNPADYIGRELTTYGMAGANYVDTRLSMRLGKNQIDQILDDFSDPGLNGGNTVTDVMLYDFDTVGGVGGDEAKVSSGDSGGPTFILVNGEPVLVGLHWFAYTQPGFPQPIAGSGDSFLPSYVSAINAAMVGESLTIVSVPEPTSLTISAVALALGGFGRSIVRRVRRQAA